MIFAILFLHVPWWRELLLMLAALPLVYYFVATIAAVRFFSRVRAHNLPSLKLPVSVLKPVRGVDFGSAENFSSFCTQDYPDYEIVFAVNDLSDPAVPIIQSTIARFPHRHIRLVTGAPRVGTNQKVNNLILLVEEARNEIVVLSDGDVRVGPNYLREVVAPLVDPRNAMVTSFYRAIAEPNLAAEFEALGAASDFFAGVVMAAATEGISFAMGASVATTKTWLARIGGFQSIADQLADDYELGNRMARADGRILISREMVWTMYPKQTWRSFWEHQIRWARTIRLCRPWSNLALIFTQGLPWLLVAVFAAPSAAILTGYAATYLVLRTAMAWTVGVWGVGDQVVRRRFWLLPVRDAIHFAVWVLGFVSNRVVWGGVRYEMQRGQMIRVP